MDDRSPDSPPAQPFNLRHTEPHPPGLFAAEHPGPPAAELETPEPPKGTQDDQTLPLWPVRGHAPGASWRRDEKGGRQDLEPQQLMLAVRAVDKHAGHQRRNGREWTGTDENTMREILARSWGREQLDRLVYLQAARMFERFCFKRSADGRRWDCRKWSTFLGALWQAYKAGAMGLSLSLEEIASEFSGSRSTAKRWIRDLAELGLIRIVKTWTCDNGTRERECGINVYQLGPTIEARIGPGLLEHASDAVRGKVLHQTAKRCAMAARAKGRAARYELQSRAWAGARRNRASWPSGRRRPSAARPIPPRPAQPGPSPTARTGPPAANPDRGRSRLVPHPSPSGRLSTRGPEGPAGMGPAAPGEGESASLRAAPAPADPPRRGDGKQPAAGAGAGPAGRASEGASAGPAPAGGAHDAAADRLPFAGVAAELAPWQQRTLGLIANPCPGCRGTGHARLPSGGSYPCCACDGTGERGRTPRGSRRADA